MSRLIRSRFINCYTWQIEASVVFLILLAVLLLSDRRWEEYVGSLAVFFSFMHAQVSDRMEEAQKAMCKPSVHCYKWATRYFVTKELLWFTYFLILQAWSALVGVFVFLLYPVWRRYYRKHNPDQESV